MYTFIYTFDSLVYDKLTKRFRAQLTRSVSYKTDIILKFSSFHY